jgi:hypothetical protein
MIVEIDLKPVIDLSAHLTILLTLFFVGMRIMYGYWPWQAGPKPRRVRPLKLERDTPAALNRAESVAGPALQPNLEIKAPQANATPVPALVLPPKAEATEDSFDRSVIITDAARPHAA